MVYDKIENIELYKGLSEDIYEGLKYLKEMNADIAPGTYEITPKVKAIVSEYETKPVNENGFESHRKNIDIQALLTGTERISFLPVDQLTETKPYNPDTDATFYEVPSGPSILNCQLSIINSQLTLLPGSFALFFPHDAHMPCLSIEKPTKVKKVVIKVSK